jgi:hypothetical protein
MFRFANYQRFFCCTHEETISELRTELQAALVVIHRLFIKKKDSTPKADGSKQ